MCLACSSTLWRLAAALAGAAVLALSGCSASDPLPPPQAGAALAAAAAQSEQPAPAEARPGSSTQPTGGTVPPTLAPVGPIPGPQIEGENAATTIQNPYANDPSALEQGRQLFLQMNCYGCHGGHAGGGMGPTLRPGHEWVYGSTAADIFDSISEGRSEGMPAWGTKLPPDVIWKLVAYIQSLGTANEPDKSSPPPASAPDSAAAQIH
jgi:mono/diheme cytochrome c family protein